MLINSPKAFTVNIRAEALTCNVRYNSVYDSERRCIDSIENAMLWFLSSRFHHMHEKGLSLYRLFQIVIIFWLQIPMLVNTKMVPRKVRVRWHSIVATTEAYAGAAVHWIGYGPQCVPYLPHFVQCCLMSLVPDFILNWFWLHVNVNKRKIK